MSDEAKEIQPWRTFVGEEPVNADFRPSISKSADPVVAPVVTENAGILVPESDVVSDLVELEVTEPADPATDTLKSENPKAAAPD